MFFNSLKFRIVFYITALLTLISVATALLTYTREREKKQIFIVSRIFSLGKTLARIITSHNFLPGQLESILKAGLNDRALSHILITNPQFHCIASTKNSLKGKNLAENYSSIVKKSPDNFSFLQWLNSTHQIILFRLTKDDIPLGFLVLHSYIPEYNINQHGSLNPIIMTCFLMIILGFLISIILSQIIVQPIEKLIQATQKMAEGDFKVSITLEGDSRLNTLAYHFNNMGHQIDEFLNQLKEKNFLLEKKVAQTTSLYQISSTLASVVDPNENISIFLDATLTALKADFIAISFLEGVPRCEEVIVKSRDENLNQQHREVLNSNGALFTALLRAETIIKDEYCFLFIPLHTSLKKIGNLIIGRYKLPYSTDEVQFAQTLTPQFTHSLHNLTLFSETQRMSEYVKNVINSLDEGVVSIDENDRIITANRTFFSILQITEKITLPFYLRELIEEKTPKEWRKRLLQLFYDSPRLNSKLEFRLPQEDTSSENIITSSFFQLVNNRNESLGRVFVLEDITEQRDLEEEASQNEKLLAIGRVAASINHEIGNAVTPVKTLTGVIAQTTEDSETLQYLEVMKKELEKIEKLLKSLKQFSKKIKLEPEKVVVSRFLHRIKLLLESELNKKGIEFQIIHSAKETFWFDSIKMQQVIMNLISNAVDVHLEYERKNPWIRIQMKQIKATGSLEIRVSDNGPGVRDKHRKEVFEAFFSTKAKGSGLGLSVCKQIVRLHGGTIQYERIEKKQTDFVLKLPKRYYQSELSSRQRELS